MRIAIITLPYKKNWMKNGRCDFASWCGCQWWPLQMARLAAIKYEGQETKIIDAQAWGLSFIEAGRMLGEYHPDECVIVAGNKVTEDDIAMAGYLNDERKIKTSIITNKEILSSVRLIEGLPLSLMMYKFIPEEYRHVYVTPSEPYPFIDMISSTGCSYGKCKFCSSEGLKYSELTTNHVVMEMEAIEKKLGYKHIMLQDDNIHERRALEISIERIKRKLKATWSCYTRPVLTRSAMSVMQRSGCLNIHVGFENGNDEILDKYHKGVHTDRMRIFMHDAREAGLHVHGDFIISADETKEQINNTIKFALELNPHTAQFQAYVDPKKDVQADVRAYQRKAYRAFYGRIGSFGRIIEQIGEPKIIP